MAMIVHDARRDRSPGAVVQRFHDEFPKRLTSLIAESGLPRWRIAEKAGVPGNYITQWRQGKCYPGAANVIRLARALNVSADELLGLR